MSYIVVRVIKKRKYRYLQTSIRIGKRVITKSIYLGPVRENEAPILLTEDDLISRGMIKPGQIDKTGRKLEPHEIAHAPASKPIPVEGPDHLVKQFYPAGTVTPEPLTEKRTKSDAKSKPRAERDDGNKYVRRLTTTKEGTRREAKQSARGRDQRLQGTRTGGGPGPRGGNPDPVHPAGKDENTTTEDAADEVSKPGESG